MGLLDFDDKAALKGIMPSDRPRWERRKKERELEENFGELQNLGHAENSADFADSAFADRKREDAPEQI